MENGICVVSHKVDVIVKFGGKIGVGISTFDKEEGYGLLLQELNKVHPIKETEPEEFKRDRTNVILHFKDEGSVEVIEKTLKEIKRRLREEKEK